jgi:hypothetical protein
MFFTRNPSSLTLKPFLKKGSRVVNYAQVPVAERVQRKNLFAGGVGFLFPLGS